MKDQWTKEYWGISHLGEFSLTVGWVTVRSFPDGSAILARHRPPHISHLHETNYPSVAEAKSAGEAIMKELKWLD